MGVFVETSHIVAVIGLVATVIAANVFAYRLKTVLRANGYKANALWLHLRDWGYYIDLYASTSDPQLKRKLRTIAIGTWGSVFLALIAVFVLGAA